jgi:ElaA protein
MDVESAVRSAPVRDLDPVTLYAILALRVQVFVVEQNCPYPELDGRDVEPDARLFWIADGPRIGGTLRLLAEPDGTARIGRVATAPDQRGAGMAAALMRAAISSAGERAIVLDAQAQLEGWYERLGFVRVGENFDEDGIAHVPMRRFLRST